MKIFWFFNVQLLRNFNGIDVNSYIKTRSQIKHIKLDKNMKES